MRRGDEEMRRFSFCNPEFEISSFDDQTLFSFSPFLLFSSSPLLFV